MVEDVRQEGAVGGVIRQRDPLGRARDVGDSRMGVLARRDRDFGTGYGSSSGYAAKRNYTRTWRPGMFKFG